MTSKLRRALSRKRRANAGWAVALVFLGLILFAFLYTEVSFVADKVNNFVSGEPSFTASYDPSTNAFMDALMYTGLSVMVAFGAIITIIGVTQKRTSGEEVI